MTTADELKASGNEAFQAGKYPEAIALYSEAIKLDESSVVLYSNRSAAYLKSGDASKALDDAEKCLELNPDFEKGYSRKAAAQKALKRYNNAIETLEEGIGKFEGNEMLASQLEEVKKEKELSTEKVRESVKRASIVQQKKAAEAESMSDFVVFAKANLALQIYSLQAQLKLLESLSEMSDDEKMSLLFSLLDKDDNGYIDARELSDAIRKRNEGMSFAEGLERAIKFVAIFDSDDDARLDPEEFKSFINTMLTELGVTFHELSEFLILQLLFSDGGNDEIEEFVGELASKEIDEAVKETSAFYDALTDERMVALFLLFDLNGDGWVDFKEVAVGLYRLSNDMEQAAKASVELLLMLDKDDQRKLDYEQFARLILNVVAAGEVTFDEVADYLTLAMCKPAVVNETELAQLVVADEMYQLASDIVEAEKDAMEVMDALQYGRINKLFDLWDLNNDGSIDYEELLLGMRKYQEAMDIDESVQSAALLMLAFDEEGNQKLSRENFCLALIKYAKALETDLHDLVDFMCVTSVLKDNDEFEKAYIHAISPQAKAEIGLIQNTLLLEDVE